MLAAVTEVIRGQGGKETETEYFAALVSAAFRSMSTKTFLNDYCFFENVGVVFCVCAFYR